MDASQHNHQTITPNQRVSLSAVTRDPGVYMMKDHQGLIIYIGKARNLKKRLAQYFTGSKPSDIKTMVMIKKVAAIETIITETEKEALILEANLIKRHRPRYNVILKDDKRYPYLRLDTGFPYPDLSIVRKPAKDGAKYFGPYSSAQSVRQTLKEINKTFKLRKCKNRQFKHRTRPCLNFQMQRCLAPCFNRVDKIKYDEIVKEVVMFLKGRTDVLIKKTTKEMNLAAMAQKFEKAAQLRDKMIALEKTLEKQVMVSNDFIDRDVIALARSDRMILITLFFVRGGVLLGSHHFTFNETISADQEIIQTFIRQYYEKSAYIPREILVGVNIEDKAFFEDWLRNIKKSKVKIHHPLRGEKARLLKLTLENAQKELENRLVQMENNLEFLSRLQKHLKLKRLPDRIECFDNSNLSGSEPVAGMVVFKQGRPYKKSYRKYKIRNAGKQDDYAYMDEILTRRFKRSARSNPFPDLLMVDGGKGQLNIAVKVLRELGLFEEIEVIGIAKKDEKKGEAGDKIYKAGRSNPFLFHKEKDLLLFLQRIRDEAHRFAITFHRKRRSKSYKRSVLDDIPGIGKRRKTLLLRHFKSVKRMREAGPKDFETVPGISEALASVILAHLNK